MEIVPLCCISVILDLTFSLQSCVKGDDRSDIKAVRYLVLLLFSMTILVTKCCCCIVSQLCVRPLPKIAFLDELFHHITSFIILIKL